MAIVYIALGSNLLHPKRQVESALREMALLPNTHILAVSPFYRSQPFGVKDQPDFLNAVLKIETYMTPHSLLMCLQDIEKLHGRKRKKERFGPRTLDLDILLYDNCSIRTDDLIIPHYAMKSREFMLYPLFDIAPSLIFPDGEPLKERLKQVPKNGLVYWSDSP